MLRPVLCATILILGSGSVTAGPFGIDKGAPLASFTVLEDKEGRAVIAPPPNAHEDFVAYAVIHHKATGVCAVMARTDDIRVNSFGTELKEKFHEIRDDLREIYKENEDLDFLKVKDPDEKTRDWTSSLVAEKRVLASFWGGEIGSTMKNNISGIKLEAKAFRIARKFSSYRGHVEIFYEFDNFKDCRDMTTKEDDEKF